VIIAASSHKEITPPSYRQFHQRSMPAFFLHTLFWQLFSSYMYVEKASKTTVVQKICTSNVEEIDACSCSAFHRFGQAKLGYGVVWFYVQDNFYTFLADAQK
jgi:hypothetical protein